MNDAQIKHMVDRFLGWKLPMDFHPDHGISFKYEPALFANTTYPIGTNLFTADQAREMFKYCLESIPSSPVSANAGKWVPVEPTEAMLVAARDWSRSKYGMPIGNDAAQGCYKVMLESAPERVGAEKDSVHVAQSEPTPFFNVIPTFDPPMICGPFVLGNWYPTQGGEWVRLMGVANQGKDHETVFDQHGRHRYTSESRGPAGRVTGSAHDYSDPGNIARPIVAAQNADAPKRTEIESPSETAISSESQSTEQASAGGGK